LKGEPFFTVFTPVYNAELSIHRVFKSINDQVFKNFEWIIIDDGSSDNSANLIRDFLEQNCHLQAQFLMQENGGKHMAWNKAVSLAKGKFFVPADADDYFLPHALEFFYRKWSEIDDMQKDQLSGINVLCFDNDSDRIVGNAFPKNGMLSNNLELNFRFNIEGEKWGCVKTSLLKERTFPIIKGSFFPESYLWLHLAKTKNVICFNTALRRYYTSTGGLSATSQISRVNASQAKIFIKYYKWLLANFGWYIIRYSPIAMARILLMFLVYNKQLLVAKFGVSKR
jgi:glycosyltransferase involved in cell wall biosynthesis